MLAGEQALLPPFLLPDQISTEMRMVALETTAASTTLCTILKYSCV